MSRITRRGNLRYATVRLAWVIASLHPVFPQDMSAAAKIPRGDTEGTPSIAVTIAEFDRLLRSYPFSASPDREILRAASHLSPGQALESVLLILRDNAQLPHWPTAVTAAGLLSEKATSTLRASLLDQIVRLYRTESGAVNPTKLEALRRSREAASLLVKPDKAEQAFRARQFYCLALPSGTPGKQLRKEASCGRDLLEVNGSMDEQIHAAVTLSLLPGDEKNEFIRRLSKQHPDRLVRGIVAERAASR